MQTLIDFIKEAEYKKTAIGHFNISETSTLMGVVEAAKKANEYFGKKLPVIVGVSEGEREFFGEKQLQALIKSFQADNLPIFLNADHTKSLEKAREAAYAGFDEILFDAGRMSLEDNKAETKKAVSEIKSINRYILVEGEIGFLGDGSQVLSGIPEGVQVSGDFLSKKEEVQEFIEYTEVDLIAPAVGNIHGVIMSGGNFNNPSIDIQRIKEIKEAISKPIVLHGGSGIRDEEIVAAIQTGVSVVHISTELRLAWKKALEESINKNYDEIAPYKLLGDSKTAVAELVLQKLKLFNGVL